MYGLRLPPVPGAQEPEAEHHDLGQEGVCGPLQVAQGPGEILRLQGRQRQVAVVAGGQHPRIRHRSRQHLAPQAHQQPQSPAPQACWAEMPASTMLPRISRNSGRSRVSSSMRRFTSW